MSIGVYVGRGDERCSIHPLARTPFGPVGDERAREAVGDEYHRGWRLADGDLQAP
jgi:hypothetical protein